jgi:apolipoprotein N-acyltransferase
MTTTWLLPTALSSLAEIRLGRPALYCPKVVTMLAGFAAVSISSSWLVVTIGRPLIAIA